jgi:hypothetical protein
VTEPDRTAAVTVLSWRDELTNVARAAAAVVVVAWIYVASTVGGDAANVRSLLPYQQLIRDRSGIEQRTFRELQAGLLEAETIRSTTAAWPTAQALSDEGVPPFAFDPTVKGARYDWRMLRAGNVINYVGIPDQGDGFAWLVFVQEPDPGIAPDQTFEDEEHHRLLDGTMLHVSIWNHAAPVNTPSVPIRVPQAEGWIQIYAVGPTQGATRN